MECVQPIGERRPGIGSITDYPLVDDTEINRISSRMDAGNAACRDSRRRDLWALAAIAEVNKARGDDVSIQDSLPRTAHLVLSLKRPDEVSTLRKVYNEGFSSWVSSQPKKRDWTD